jgi:hypothetical protein
MSVTAKLRLQLLADSVVVAESDDPSLWQQVLTAISGATALPKAPTEKNDQLESPKSVDAVDALARELDLPRNMVEGACSPSLVDPFIHLDSHFYEALKKKSSRGPGSVAPAVLAATLLLLWFKTARVDKPVTVVMAQAVLRTLSLRDANAYRSIKNAHWIQSRGNSLVLNPASISDAIRVARAYCGRLPLQE